MSTLSLPPGAKRKVKPEAEIPVSEPVRTAKKIREVPVEKMTGQYAVMRQSDTSMRFTCLHDSQEQAIAEAHRLAGERTDRHLFLVMHVVATVGAI
jgi:hypothetical protein